MKFSVPSLLSLGEQFIKMVRRFPLAVLCAFVGTFAALRETRPPGEWNDPFWISLLLCAGLGLVFSIFISIYTETKSKKKPLASILRIGLLLLLIVYFLTLSKPLLIGDWYRFILLAALGHLLVSLAPFWEKGHINGFWHYNKTLFLRFLRAALYSAVLFAGICIAIVALNELFKLNIEDEIYFRIWLVITGIFNTCIFLAGVPRDPLQLDEETLYPKGLKIFTQFVLIPLVSIYVIILLAYELKIIIQWELPRGWVANLIIAFAIFGILSLLLVFPVRKDPENKWITIYSKVFYWIMFPLTILLFVAIGTRISSYGFTEERFWVLATGIWLLFISIYFIWNKKENIKVVPASLIVVILVTLFIAPPVCIQSQQKRLIKILVKNNIIKNGKVAPPMSPLSLNDRQEMTSIIQYLYETHGRSSVQPFFNTDLSQFSPGLSAYNFADSVLSTVGIETASPLKRYSDSGSVAYFSFYSNTEYSIETTGYDYYLSGAYLHLDQGSENTWYLADTMLSAKLDKGRIILKINEKPVIMISIDALVKKAAYKYGYNNVSSYNPGDVSLVAENDQIKVKLIIRSMRGEMKKGEVDYENLGISLNYLIRFKQ